MPFGEKNKLNNGESSAIIPKKKGRNFLVIIGTIMIVGIIISVILFGPFSPSLLNQPRVHLAIVTWSQMNSTFNPYNITVKNVSSIVMPKKLSGAAHYIVAAYLANGNLVMIEAYQFNDTDYPQIAYNEIKNMWLKYNATISNGTYKGVPYHIIKKTGKSAMLMVFIVIDQYLVIIDSGYPANKPVYENCILRVVNLQIDDMFS